MLKEYNTDQIRNVAIIGHLGTGKSTLFDAMLFLNGKLDRIGNPDTGLTSDFDEDEKEKKISIRSSLGFVELDDVKINILDTPGTSDFVGESRAALQACEAAVLVVDSVDGVQIETEKAWRYLTENNIPRIIFVNKMDKERANYDNVINNIKTSLNASIASLCIPQGEAETFSGVVDTVEMKLMSPKDGGRKVTVSDIPDDMKEFAQVERENLIELAAEGDDELLEKFFEEENLSDDEIKKGISIQLSEAKLTPVICGSATQATGIKNLLNVIKSYIPSPKSGYEYKGHEAGKPDKERVVISGHDQPFSAVIWKTFIDQYAGKFTYMKVIAGELLPDSEAFNASRNSKERISKIFTMEGNKQVELSKLVSGDIGVVVKLDKATTTDTLCAVGNDTVVPLIKLPEPVFSYAVETVNKADVDKVGQFFTRVTEENPTITYKFSAETAETVLSGMGEQQLNIILKSLKEKAKLDVETRVPRVAYRETIMKKSDATYKHKKQSGGHGQFGEVFIRMSPRQRGEGYSFKESIFGGSIPKQYIPGVEKGFLEALQQGVLGKFPVVDVEVELYDGKYHDVDSSEMAFKIAGRNAFKLAMEAAGPQLLEPVMEVHVFVDKEYMGDILSDVTSRRGRVLGMDSAEDSGSNISVVKATVPLSEMLRYTIDLRAMTSGKATFEMQFSHYDPIAGRDADKILEERKKQLEDEANK